MTLTADGTGLLCVEPGRQRAEPCLWAVGSSGPWERLRLLGPLSVWGHNVSRGLLFVTVWQDVISFHKPLYFDVSLLTNCWCTNMLAWGLAVVPGLGMGVGPLVSHNPIYQCSCKGERGSNRSSQVPEWSVRTDGLTSHRIFQSAWCSLPCVSASWPFPEHASALPHPPVHRLCPLPQSPFGCFCVSTPALMELLENLLWPWRNASAMWGLSSPGRSHVRVAAGVALASPPKGKGQASPVAALRPVLWRYLSQVLYTYPHQQTGHLQGPFYRCDNIKMIDLSGFLFFFFFS